MFNMDLMDSLCGLPPRADTGWVTKPADDDYWYGPRGVESSTGIEIDEHTALSYTTVYACVAKIAKTVATLPLFIFERMTEDAKRPARDHPLFAILHDSPDPDGEADATSFWESRMANTLLWGTGYAEVVRTNSGNQVMALLPLYSSSVTRRIDGAGRSLYEIREQGKVPRYLLPSQIFRIPGLSLNGVTGLSVIGYQREAVGLGVAAAKFGGRFFKQGAVFPGVIKIPRHWSPEAYDRFQAGWEKRYGGADNAYRTPLLEDGAEYQPIGMPLRDAQFLELRQYERTEICGLFDVPPHKVGETKGTTAYASVEEANIDWVVGCIGPWCMKVRAAINHQILRDDQRYYAEHIVEGMLRGDIQRRYAAYATGRQWGWLTINDILRKENMNTIGPEGDRHLEPLNMKDAGEPDPEPTKPARKPVVPDDEEASAKITTTAVEIVTPTILDACQRIVTKEVRAIGNAWKKHAKGGTEPTFLAWLDGFYAEHQECAEAALLPGLKALAALRHEPPEAAEQESRRQAKGYAALSVAAVRDCLTTSPERLPAELEKWNQNKAQMMVAVILGRECSNG